MLLPESNLPSCAREHRRYPCPPVAQGRTVVCDGILMGVQLRACELLSTSNEWTRRERRVRIGGEELLVHSLGLVPDLDVLRRLLRRNKGVGLLDDMGRWSALLVREVA